jgi:hypothetical protein
VYPSRTLRFRFLRMVLPPISTVRFSISSIMIPPILVDGSAWT